MCDSILRKPSLENNEFILRNNQNSFPELPTKSDIKLFRSLTPGEIKLAKTIFDNVINCDRVKIYCENNQSRTQSGVITTTKNGEVLLSMREYRDDFSTDYISYHDSVKYPHLFIFAMTFVWQYYRYDSSFCDTYASTIWCSYTFNKPSFNFYTMEQQASIIADYWLLNKYDLTEYKGLSGYKEYDRFQIDMRMNLLKKYKTMLNAYIRCSV